MNLPWYSAAGVTGASASGILQVYCNSSHLLLHASNRLVHATAALHYACWGVGLHALLPNACSLQVSFHMSPWEAVPNSVTFT